MSSLEPSESPDDAALFAVMASGPAPAAREALGVLYERHQAALDGFLRRLLRNSADRDDVLHDTFLLAARRAQAFRGGSARAWLCRIAANRVSDLRRSDGRRKRREGVASRAEAQDPQAPGTELDLAMRALPERWRAALELRFGAGLTHAEVAEALGISLRSAKHWCHQGKQCLAAQLAPEADSGERGKRS